MTGTLIAECQLSMPSRLYTNAELVADKGWEKAKIQLKYFFQNKGTEFLKSFDKCRKVSFKREEMEIYLPINDIKILHVLSYLKYLESEKKYLQALNIYKQLFDALSLYDEKDISVLRFIHRLVSENKLVSNLLNSLKSYRYSSETLEKLKHTLSMKLLWDYSLLRKAIEVDNKELINSSCKAMKKFAISEKSYNDFLVYYKLKNRFFTLKERQNWNNNQLIFLEHICSKMKILWQRHADISLKLKDKKAYLDYKMTFKNKKEAFLKKYQKIDRIKQYSADTISYYMFYEGASNIGKLKGDLDKNIALNKELLTYISKKYK